MKMSEKQIKRLVHLVLKELKESKSATFKDKDEKVAAVAAQLVAAELRQEADLDQEVHRMMDELERQNPGSFERYKMFPLLKKRLAKEKGIIL